MLQIRVMRVRMNELLRPMDMRNAVRAALLTPGFWLLTPSVWGAQFFTSLVAAGSEAGEGV